MWVGRCGCHNCQRRQAPGRRADERASFEGAEALVQLMWYEARILAPGELAVNLVKKGDLVSGRKILAS